MHLSESVSAKLMSPFVNKFTFLASELGLVLDENTYLNNRTNEAMILDWQNLCPDHTVNNDLPKIEDLVSISTKVKFLGC